MVFMGKKLFVGGLSWNTTEDSLRGAFEKFGSLEEVKVIIDRQTGKSKGFGFVTFTDDQSANKAMEEMDGVNFEGRNIRVNEANAKRPVLRNKRRFNDNRRNYRNYNKRNED